MESTTQAEGLSKPATTTRYRPEFRADAKEYFRIWIVNLALTIVTLGIYSAWAKVRKLRYFYSNTLIAGSAFGYHAEPLAILKGRLIAAALGATYFAATQFSPIAAVIVLGVLALAMPWLLVKSRMFAMRMTSWRGLRFTFRPDYKGSYAVLLGWGLASVLTFGILIPVFLRERFRFVATRTGFGDKTFECEPSIGRFYKTAIVAVGIALLITLAFVLVVVAAFFIAKPAAEAGTQSQMASLASVIGAIVYYVALLSIAGGYTQARNLNEVFNRTSLGRHRLHSTLSAYSLMYIYLTNILGILFTLGLYTPWAQIRLARYRLQAIELEVAGSLDEFVASAGAATPAATGEEITELFDVDFGF